MLILATIVFWLSVGLVFHSYVLYPIILKLCSWGKEDNKVVFSAFDTDLPKVYILFSVFNEQKVISEKLKSIIDTTYPVDKFEVYIGSDNSTDDTNAIIRDFALKNDKVKFFSFLERNGKSGVINKLVAQLGLASLHANDVLILTDANVIFTPTTIYELAKHFKEASIGQVAANILSHTQNSDGIAVQETSYIQRENRVKYLEGLNWGTMMGAFGACYAMRADCWIDIPRNFLMEDFYLSMHVLAQNKKAISEQNAICYEDVSTEVGEEFKRKSRIQAGNFQNLAAYGSLLLGFNAVAFCFLSHKVIRWLGPVFICLAYISNLMLINRSWFYVFTFTLQNLLLVSPVVDALLKRVGIHLVLLRFASYFYTMNLALINGFVMYLRGIKTNTWNPTKRTV